MALKVIGAGFGRTGTLSLKFALEQLGFNKCYHMLEVHQNPGHRAFWLDAAAGKHMDWEQIFAGYEAAVDWPSCNFWREQMVAFPQAQVILSRRDPDKWYDSVMNTIWKFTAKAAQSGVAEAVEGTRLAYEAIWDPVFQRRMDDRAHVIAQYEKHNAEVIAGVPPQKLLVYEPGQGWQPLCDFLGVPVPETDYPRVNTTEEFVSRWRS